MSQKEELRQYRSTSGTNTKTADIPNDSHDLREEIGEGEENQQRKYDATISGQRFVNFYSDKAASIREFLSNAETACIRRAKAELRDAGYGVPNSVAAVIEKAKQKTGYAPVIEVQYNRNPNATALIIEDNGIGISRTEYKVLQRVGYSVSHTDGDVSGQFGIGVLSGFLLCGIHEGFNLITKSYNDGASYETTEFLANFEYGTRTRDAYGTRFEFNTFCHKAKQEIDVPQAVERFSEGLRVPVIYRDYDESGSETSLSEDYTAHNIEDDYPDNALVITYEDEFVKAVMSPASSSSHERTTYNVIMDIRRNTDTYRTKCGAPWEWDVRVKVEDGSIVHVMEDTELPEWADSKEELIGLSPIDNQKYAGLTDRQKEEAIKRSELPEDVITAPRPSASRDSFKSGNDDFWKYVGSKLSEKWKEECADMLNSLDSFEDYVDLEAGDKSLVNRAYSDYGPDTTRSESEDNKSRSETINEALEDNLGISLDTDVAVKIDQLKYRKNLVPRGTDEPRLKGNSKEEKIWKIIDKASGDEIYMGKSITDKKAEIAWGLSDNTQVVRVEEYEKLEKLFGWKKLKDLPTRDIDEKLPELEQDVIDRWNNTTTLNKTSGSGNNRRTSRDPTTKSIKVRVGRNDPKKWEKHNAGYVYDSLDNGDTIAAGSWSKHAASALIIFDQTETSRVYPVANAADYHLDLAAAKVPKYVYEYLKQADNVYESEQEYRRERSREKIKLGTGTSRRFCDLRSNDLLVVASEDFEEQYGDQLQTVKQHVCDRTDTIKTNNVSSETLVQPSDIESNIYGFENTEATIVRLSEANTTYCVRKLCQDKVTLNTGRLYLETELPDADFNSDEFQYIFGTNTPKDTETFRNTVELIKQSGGTFPSQDG